MLKRPLEPSELVRISKSRMAFERGYTANWTEELFRVVRVLKEETPTVYEIEDYRARGSRKHFIDRNCRGWLHPTFDK